MNLDLTNKNKLAFSTIVDAVAEALNKSEVKALYNYPGRPATHLVEKVKEKYSEIDVQDYLPNEFVATAKGFGSSVAGQERSVVVFKDVGTNLASDLLHCINHVGINRGLVFFVSDDPSAWYSQNEQDSRGIYFNAELPFIEPYDQYSAYYSVLAAYELSEIIRLPIFIRTTGRSIAERFNSEKNELLNIDIPKCKDFKDIPFDAKNKWKSIFGTVEEDREELLQKHEKLRAYFEDSPLNVVKGNGELGIIASGFIATQLEQEGLAGDVSLLKLATVYPLPEKLVTSFIKDKKRILVLDQGEPLLERLVRDCAQRNGYSNLILGKLNGYVRAIGEARDFDLKIAVESLRTGDKSKFPKHEKIAKAPAFKEEDGYRVMLECLRKAVKETGVRPLYTGDAGQPCQIPDTPNFEEMLHMETTMGACVSFLSGGIESYLRKGLEPPFKGIAYVGDSDFFHSAFAGIAEAAAKNHPILMILMDNQGAVSTGKQAHLGMRIGDQLNELSIKNILKSLEIKEIVEASTKNKEDLYSKIVSGIKSNNFYSLIVHTTN